MKKKKAAIQKTRKELRKEQRLLKKAKKNEFFQRKKNPSKLSVTSNKESIENKTDHQPKKSKVRKEGKHLAADRDGMQRLQKDMQKQRIKQLKRANEDEDKEIKKLEKQLKLNKRKRKSVPKSFAADGLDYLLEVCEQDNLKQTMLIDQNLHESGSEFEDDFMTITGTKKKDNMHEKETDDIDNTTEQDDDLGSEDSINSDEFSKDEISISNFEVSESNDTHKKETKGVKRQIASDERDVKTKRKKKKHSLQQFVEDDVDFKKEQEESRPIGFLIEDSTTKNKKKKLKTKKENIYSENDESSDGDELIMDREEEEENDGSSVEENKQDDEFWEDIYGRTRDRQGNIVQAEKSKYVPPHLRAKEANESSKKKEQLTRLNKQMKGLINRLTENNMSSISSQIEELYMSNSRNDMNESLTNLLLDSLVATVNTPERLIMEHAMLIAILHANVGTEVGAHVLQTLVKKFDEQLQAEQEIENKELDNVVLILSHLYNFKVFSAVLMYNILEKLAERFGEKEVSLILLILKNIGFSLRKDNPLALKELILKLQQKAGEAMQFKNNARVKFMLEVLLAIKNNNMAKIPNYDQSHIEHLKKLLKGFLRKGNYVTELKISLQDLLNADERGRWWIVGSAWSGMLPGETEKKDLKEGPEVRESDSNQYSKQLLQLAQKQHMNTDARKNIFCILMTAEDYLDAFEKLLHLGLKNQQEREIIHVIMHCCLQERQFNPYYYHLAQKFCDFDRKFQISIQYAVWDKFKELQNISSSQLTNLAKFILHLIIEKGLPLSVLKVIHFAEVDKITVKFLRQLLLGLLLHESEEDVQQAFQRVALSKNLHIFREGIRLFIHHFLLRKLESHSLKNVELLKQRAKMADKILGAAESKVKF